MTLDQFQQLTGSVKCTDKYDINRIRYIIYALYHDMDTEIPLDKTKISPNMQNGVPLRIQVEKYARELCYNGKDNITLLQAILFDRDQYSIKLDTLEFTYEMDDYKIHMDISPKKRNDYEFLSIKDNDEIKVLDNLPKIPLNKGEKLISAQYRFTVRLGWVKFPQVINIEIP